MECARALGAPGAAFVVAFAVSLFPLAGSERAHAARKAVSVDASARKRRRVLERVVASAISASGAELVSANVVSSCGDRVVEERSI